MSAQNFLNQIQQHIEKYVGPKASEIILNSLIGGVAGYICMKLARSSAAVVGTCLIGIEILSENEYIVFDRQSTLEKCRKTFLEWFSLDEFYRRCAQRGFLGGMLIGMSMA